jgi:hypothetical protein
LSHGSFELPQRTERFLPNPAIYEPRQHDNPSSTGAAGDAPALAIRGFCRWIWRIVVFQLFKI